MTNAPAPLKTDRWLEIDLYWFEHTDMEKSVNEFWDRYYPLMEGVEGWKGVIMNVGWISDYLLEWHGNLKEKISMPKNMRKWPWFKDEGQFSGNSIDRIKLWEDRFKKADSYEVINYEAWTYADLKKLCNLIRKVAFTKHGLAGIKVGTFLLGWESAYDGDKTVFAKKHPNAYLNNGPDYLARLEADHTGYGAFPGGIPEGTPFTEFFGKQWGHLSKAVGLDVIVLRDGYLGVGVYGRRGPFGKTASADPEKVKSWSEGTADLIRQTKMSNPDALVIGYSNAASAIADWRVNCFDLEAIAKEGYLDGWIDQTWAGAWNEVGQRPFGFWNNQLLGWTYELSYMLGSPTPYVLTARVINDAMKTSGLLHVDYIGQYQPVNLSMWQLKDGSFRIMAGNLEEGINHTSNQSVSTTLNLPDPSLLPEKIEIRKVWNGAKSIIWKNKLHINLGQAQTKLFVIKGIGAEVEKK